MAKEELFGKNTLSTKLFWSYIGMSVLVFFLAPILNFIFWAIGAKILYFVSLSLFLVLVIVLAVIRC